MSRPRQLPLDLPTLTARGREDFLVSPSNEAAYALIDGWPSWPEGGALLVGPPGAGKSHLAAILAEAAGASVVPAGDLKGATVPALVGPNAVVVEDVDRVPLAEAALFHLLNLARETATPLLVTARSLPTAWTIATPDLLSRLRALSIVAIAPPDEALLRALLVKLFVDRQMVVDTGVVDYLALHLDRSFDAVREAVAALDAEALSRGRRINRTMASEIIAGLARDDASDT